MTKIPSKLLIVCALLTAVLLATSSFQTSGTGGYKYATMTVIQRYPGAPGLDPKITIVYEDDKTEEIELEKTSERTILSITKKTNSALNMMGDKGYELVSATDNRYTFVKK